MTAVAAGVAALTLLLGFAVWRGRQVAIAIAAAECPDCRVPLVTLDAAANRGSILARADAGPDQHAHVAPTWEVHACPSCDRVVTTVGDQPSPVASCAHCGHKSLAVYAERIGREVTVDEWCDLCGRRARTVLPFAPMATRRPIAGRRGPAPPEPAQERSARGQVLPFRRKP